jgi:hypothetical protein
MNVGLEETEGHVNGVVTNRYGDTFIRGNNGPVRLDVVLHGTFHICLALAAK